MHPCFHVTISTGVVSLAEFMNIDRLDCISCRPPTLPPKPKKKFAEVRPGKEGSRPKLFGGSIEEYVEVKRGGDNYDDDDGGNYDDDDDGGGNDCDIFFVIIGFQYRR